MASCLAWAFNFSERGVCVADGTDEAETAAPLQRSFTEQVTGSGLSSQGGMKCPAPL